MILMPLGFKDSKIILTQQRKTPESVEVLSVFMLSRDYHKTQKFHISTSFAHVEKARLIAPFGHSGFDPSGKIRMTP